MMVHTVCMYAESSRPIRCSQLDATDDLDRRHVRSRRRVKAHKLYINHTITVWDNMCKIKFPKKAKVMVQFSSS